MKRIAFATFVAALCLAAACGFSKPAAHNDAGLGLTDAPPDAGTCVFDNSTFDNGCTFAP